MDSAALAAMSTRRKIQEGLEGDAEPAPRQTASSTNSSVVNIAHFRCEEMAWRATALTSRSSTAPRPEPKATKAAAAPRHRFQVPTVAAVAPRDPLRSNRAANSSTVAESTSAMGKCTTKGCQLGKGLMQARQAGRA